MGVNFALKFCHRLYLMKKYQNVKYSLTLAIFFQICQGLGWIHHCNGYKPHPIAVRYYIYKKQLLVLADALK